MRKEEDRMTRFDSFTSLISCSVYIKSAQRQIDAHEENNCNLSPLYSLLSCAHLINAFNIWCMFVYVLFGLHQHPPFDSPPSLHQSLKHMFSFHCGNAPTTWRGEVSGWQLDTLFAADRFGIITSRFPWNFLISHSLTVNPALPGRGVTVWITGISSSFFFFLPPKPSPPPVLLYFFSPAHFAHWFDSCCS